MLFILLWTFTIYLAGQWDSHKSPGFHPRYLKLCSEDEQNFYGFGTTWGLVKNLKNIFLGWSIPVYIYIY